LEVKSCAFGKNLQRGLLIVFTGNGKGKTTAALGCAFRALGYRCRVCMIQFIKGPLKSGELQAVKEFGGRMEIHPMGKGFIRNEKDSERNREVALRAWEFAKSTLNSAGYDLVILDELTYLVKFGLLGESELLAALEARPKNLHVIVTGRDAPDSLIEAADMATEMNEVKHPLREGIAALEGIDF
jgi:cob(I)alamin adenosyltransferase